MARLPRLVIPDQPHHVIQRGNDRQIIFRDDDDFLVFIGHLREAARFYGVAIHAYVLMSNHVHLLATPSDAEGLGRMMQWIGRQYVPYFNRKYERTGTLWEGRYKATVIDTERYFMICMRYIEVNPVRAGVVGDAVEYRWSSYHHHAGLGADPVITDHPLYWALGNTPFERELAYKALVAESLAHADMEALRNATQKGWALGSKDFKNILERSVKRHVVPKRAGRPRKTVDKLTGK